ncbi:hypothetical protein [Limisphaera sp. VF-2]|uniref:hypothetical protein n=1 Tax=Limisphaera sp. VF-2 TaxID=3400418 RepID=UPI00176D7993
MRQAQQADGAGCGGRWWDVRRVVQVAGCGLVGLGVAKLVAVGLGEPQRLSGGPERVSSATHWAVVQGVGEIGAGAAAIWLPAPLNCAVLTVVGSGFLVW